MRRPSPMLVLVAATSGLSFACGVFPALTCGPGTVERDHQCVTAAPATTCGPGTVLSGASCLPEPPPPEIFPEAPRIVSDLHGLVVPIPGDAGIGTWMFTYPTEFHDIHVERTTQAVDVLQMDVRLQMEDFNTHAHYTLWATLLYTRQLSSWRLESATVTDSRHEWVDTRPVVPPTPVPGGTPPGPVQ